MPTHPLARDVFMVILAKLMLAVVVGLFVFGPGQRPRVDAGTVESRLMGVPIAKPAPGDTSP
jgi:hypothetical protein